MALSVVQTLVINPMVNNYSLNPLIISKHDFTFPPFILNVKETTAYKYFCLFSSIELPTHCLFLINSSHPNILNTIKQNHQTLYWCLDFKNMLCLLRLCSFFFFYIVIWWYITFLFRLVYRHMFFKFIFWDLKLSAK